MFIAPPDDVRSLRRRSKSCFFRASRSVVSARAADSKVTKSALTMFVLPERGMLKEELSSVTAAMSMFTPRLSPAIVAAPEA